MREVCYSDVRKINLDGKRLEEIQFLTETFFADYPIELARGEEILLFRQILPFVKLFGNDIKGRRILDLGCGFDKSFYGGLVYSPWFCRFLTKLGADVVGVDIGDNQREKFESYRRDLTKKNCLDFLPNYSVDIAHAGGIFNLPDVDYLLLKENLLPQLERVVKKEGTFLYQDFN
jgi:SAM-dependent methyltransferase